MQFIKCLFVFDTHVFFDSDKDDVKKKKKSKW